MNTFEIIMKKWCERYDKVYPMNNVVQETIPLFPLVTDKHAELHNMMVAYKDIFSNTHFNWLIDQIEKDTSESFTSEIITHVKNTITSVNEITNLHSNHLI